jgi:serine/threonine-protein kinase
VDVDGPDADAAAAKMRTSEIREVLVSMLYQWITAINERREEAIRLARIGIAADPDPLRGKLVEAAIRADQQAILDLAAQADPVKLSPSSAMLVANCYELAGQAPRALPLLREVIRRHPDDFPINFALAECYLRIAMPPQPDEAVRFFTAANALRPQNAGVFIEFGHAFERQFRLDDAVQAFREACRPIPEHPGPRDVLTLALREQGKLAEAEVICREALRLKSDDAVALNSLRSFSASRAS